MIIDKNTGLVHQSYLGSNVRILKRISREIHGHEIQAVLFAQFKRSTESSIMGQLLYFWLFKPFCVSTLAKEINGRFGYMHREDRAQCNPIIAIDQLSIGMMEAETFQHTSIEGLSKYLFIIKTEGSKVKRMRTPMVSNMFPDGAVCTGEYSGICSAESIDQFLMGHPNEDIYNGESTIEGSIKQSPDGDYIDATSIRSMETEKSITRKNESCKTIEGCLLSLGW